jgi:aromatic ring-opening dioxygenase catalytic subunit (LigB family)
MAEIVMAYSASHAPMMTADRESAPREQADNFFGALRHLREQAIATEVQAVVMLSGEHFSNFFFNNLPQLVIGLGDSHVGPKELWLKIPKVAVPSDPALAQHLMNETVAAGFQPAMSTKMTADHGFMTVYYELDPLMRLPMVPIVMNCTTPPLMTLRHCYNFGIAVGEAIRSYSGLERVALVGAGGLSHFVGEPRVGDIDEEFDRWFLDKLESGDLDDVLDMPNDELMLAGNGTGEVRAWVAVAGAMRGHGAKSLSYEAIYEWINGMGVILYEGDAK